MQGYVSLGIHLDQMKEHSSKKKSQQTLAENLKTSTELTEQPVLYPSRP